MIDLSNVPVHLQVTGGLLGLLLLGFILLFLIPGVLHWFRLRAILVGLLAFKGPTPPGDIKKLFARDKRLAHLWGEYQDTLHVQREERDGQMKVFAVRSTAPAESYFSGQYLVDSRLRTEFFKHLPGIFTGLGIIGTFTGLIEGLRRFQVSENAVTVRASLESLMHAVGEAFLISAAAIAAAMLVTFVEKLILAGLYRKAEEIAHAIDAQFDAGAGEEYLARLVTASEASASQSKILKDALVKELGDILRELTASQLANGEKLNLHIAQRIEDAANRQVAAAREDNQALGDVIAGSIEKSLKGPLEDIASSVKTASGDQSATAVQMLNDVMVSFSQRLNDLFGGQISGINELNKQTAQGMQDAVSSLHTLVGKLEESGKRSTDDMAAQMAASIKAMEERQGNMNAESQAFVEQIRELVESSQAETQQKLQATLESIGQGGKSRPLGLAQVPIQVVDVLQGQGVSRHRAYAHQRVAETVYRQTEQCQKIAHLLALKEAAKMQDGDASLLKCGGDVIQTTVGAAEHGLVAQPDTVCFQLPDAGRNSLGLFVGKFELTNLRQMRARPAVRFERERQHPGGSPHLPSDRHDCSNDRLGRAVVHVQPIDHRAGIVRLKAHHVGRRGAAKPIDRLPCVADHP